MPKPTRLMQCVLGNERTRLTAWLPKEYAQEGARIELAQNESWRPWTVLKVYGPPLEQSYVREHQRVEFGSLNK